MPAELVTKNGQVTSPPTVPAIAEDELRAFARKRIERIRRVKMHVAGYVVGMLVLTPVWLLVEWQDNGAFERWSDQGNPGDWEPWILYVALIWGLVVALMALRAYFDRPATEAEIEREVGRLTGRR